MAREVYLHKLNDWTQMDATEAFWFNLNLTNPEFNFGIHRYNEKLWTSGFVGVGRLYDHNQYVVQSNGKEHIVVISSQYGMNPWQMLEIVLADDEYESYAEELRNDNKFLFRVFYDQPIVRLAQDEVSDGDLLYALSFINSCYTLCKKGLKKAMLHREENCSSKVRGKIDVKKNIRENTSRGRNDRFYCKYIDFTEDNIENRIIKATLKKCKAILDERFEVNTASSNRIHFCMQALRHVRIAPIKSSDFSSASVSGLYMYYKPVLQQAKNIFHQKYCSYTAENGQTLTKSVYIIPYMINMETLFELFTRAMFKAAIDGDRFGLDAYSKKWFLMRDVTCIEETEKGIHLMPYCIPDIVVRDKTSSEVLAVIDVKYKAHDRAVRADSLQLLTYVLLTGVNKCGFVFPGAETYLKQMRTSGTAYLPLQTPTMNDLKYYELLLGNSLSKAVLEPLLQ